jgi:hypothetical protein
VVVVVVVVRTTMAFSNRVVD